MLPDPLHPVVVHFPVVLAVLLPIFAVGALWTIRRGARPRRAWSVPLAVAAALAVSAWVALATGESTAERVETVVADAPLDAHEEAAEAFIAGSVVVLVLMGVGLAPGLVGGGARLVSTVGAVALVAGAFWVGHSGGQLVYRHGAANAYASPSDRAVTDSAAGTVRSTTDSNDDR